MSKPTISTITDLGHVVDEDTDLINKIDGFTVPFGNSSATVNANLRGRRRLFTITGIQDGTGYTGGTVDIKLNAFITNIESWVNPSIGAQTARTYTDTLGNTYTVVCINFKKTRRIDGNGRIIYVLTLVEGGVLS